jgi:uncharacterized protein YjiS (DUF1127 family)
MLAPLRHRWRRNRDTRRFWRNTADLPDHILRDIGLDRNQIGPTLARHLVIAGY